MPWPSVILNAAFCICSNLAGVIDFRVDSKFGLISSLFKEIENSKEYMEYLDVKERINNDELISSLIEEIKELEKKATKLEYSHDEGYKEIDNIVSKKVDELNSMPLYIDYLGKMKKINELLKSSSNIIETYINEKIQN